MLSLKAEVIGGGYARRRCTIGPRQMMAGEHLSKEEVLAIPRANRDAMVRNGLIELYPAMPGGGGSSHKAERHVIMRGPGRYFVIEGTKLNEEPLSKEDAEALAKRR